MEVCLFLLDQKFGLKSSVWQLSPKDSCSKRQLKKYFEQILLNICLKLDIMKGKE